jgi:hypothetical protein
MSIDPIGASDAQVAATRAVAAVAKALRVQREQAAATVALIEQAGPPAPGTGRLIDVRA